MSNNYIQDMSLVIKAADFAARKHNTQRRKDAAQTPYVNHPIGAAYILTNEAKVYDAVTLAGAILHDTVEDTDTSFEEIRNEFGDEVLSVVRDVTDDKSLSKEETKRLQIVHAPHICEKAKYVKLADKLNNLRDLERYLPVGWDKETARKYASWSREVVSKLKGLNETLDKELEDVIEKILVKYQ
uniref:Guanosine-3',5'-bis(diphosphate) 3'-pyrophosphohydrolase MESH1 n=1 Tax=Acrobeloides nanus TaxID=290746 RepID=A0A914CGZ9_9BILA